MPRKQTLERAAGLLEAARAQAPAARARAERLTRLVEDARHDRRRRAEAGAALEELRKGKSYKALGFATYAAFLASVGISRSRAHVWRTAAAQSEAAEAEAEGDRGEAAARRIANDMATRGVKGKVFLVGEGDDAMVRVEVAIDQAGRVRIT